MLPNPCVKRLVRLILFLSAGFYSAGLARGEATPTATNDPLAGLPPDVVALLTGKTKWTTSVSGEASFGFNDNVLLSFTRPERSAFARYGVEAFAWHLPRGGTDYLGLVSAEQTHYFSSETVNRESNAIAFLQWRHRFGDWLKFGLDLRGIYSDEIYDVSDSDLVRAVVQQKRLGGTGGAHVRLTPRPWVFLELQGLGTRDRYDDHFDDAKLGDGTARIGFNFRDHVELSIGGAERRRHYDERVQYTLGGRPLSALLEIKEHEHDAKLETNWGEVNRWSTVTQVGELDYDDNGTGYFNYRRKFAAQKIEWRNERWRVAFHGAAKRSDYEFQTQGSGLAPPLRIKDYYETRLRVERKLGARWTVYAVYTWERSRSNDPLAEYRLNEGLLGARWSWEK